MKIFKLIFILLFLVLIGGFVYFAMIDVNPEQTQITKSVANETFLDDSQ